MNKIGINAELLHGSLWKSIPSATQDLDKITSDAQSTITVWGYKPCHRHLYQVHLLEEHVELCTPTFKLLVPKTLASAVQQLVMKSSMMKVNWINNGTTWEVGI